MTSDQFRKALDRLKLSQLGAARLFGSNDRTVRRWAKAQSQDHENGLRADRTETLTTGNIPVVGTTNYPAQREMAWGARRIKHQFNLPCSWRTVHRILKKHGLLIRVKAKPQPSGK